MVDALQTELPENLQQLLARGAVLIHVGVRHHGVQSRKRCAVEDFVLLVGGGGERVGGVVAGAVGHFFDATDDYKIVQPAGDRGVAQAQSCSSGTTGSLDLDRFNAAQPHKVCNKRAKVFLPG